MTEAIWLFGYGSLIWRPDFAFVESRRAHITGWSRRFWQGSHDHRGVASDPGRVVTLVEMPKERCYGRAYLVQPDVFDHLDHREKNGYDRQTVEICFTKERVTGVVYIAPTNNHAYVGKAPLAEIAAHIIRCAGTSGTNVEYLLELAFELRNLDISDQHVFDLESRVLALREN